MKIKDLHHHPAECDDCGEPMLSGHGPVCEDCMDDEADRILKEFIPGWAPWAKNDKAMQRAYPEKEPKPGKGTKVGSGKSIKRPFAKKHPKLHDVVAHVDNPRMRIGYVSDVETDRQGKKMFRVNLDGNARKKYWEAGPSRLFPDDELISIGKIEKGKFTKWMRKITGRIPPRHKQIKALLNGTVDVTFRKVNGKIRKMRCTLDPEMVPKYLRKTMRRKKWNEKVISVWETDLAEWRSYRVESVMAFEPWVIDTQVESFIPDEELDRLFEIS